MYKCEFTGEAMKIKRTRLVLIYGIIDVLTSTLYILIEKPLKNLKAEIIS